MKNIMNKDVTCRPTLHTFLLEYQQLARSCRSIACKQIIDHFNSTKAPHPGECIF